MTNKKIGYSDPIEYGLILMNF